MNTKAVGNTVSDVLDSIASSKWGKQMLTNIDEINTTMGASVAKKIANSNKIIDNEVSTGLKTRFNALSDMANKASERRGMNPIVGNTEKEAILDAIADFKTKNMDDSFDKIKEALSKTGLDDDDIKDLMDEGKRLVQRGETVRSDFVDIAKQSPKDYFMARKGDLLGKAQYYGHVPGAYFNPADKAKKYTRIGTAVGAYAGVSIAGRYIQGGTLTKDQYGQKNIAGVPFL